MVVFADNPGAVAFTSITLDGGARLKNGEEERSHGMQAHVGDSYKSMFIPWVDRDRLCTESHTAPHDSAWKLLQGGFRTPCNTVCNTPHSLLSWATEQDISLWSDVLE